tara:strand:+ start:4202 stop:4789 length:588 start_codon:yes stop_codon:yes gene_type:complete
MILDERGVDKLFKKVDCFQAIGMAVLPAGATAAAASTAGMSAVSLGLTVLGTGFTAMQQAQQGKTANMFAQRNAQIQTRNAQIAQQNAEFNAKLKEREDKRRRSSQVAGLQPSGVEIFEGTNLIAMAEQEYTDDMNAQLIRRGGTIESQNLVQQAGITSAQGKASQQAGYLGAGSSLLTGAGKAGMHYTEINRIA